MTHDVAVYLSQQLLKQALIISAPVVMVVMIVGLVVSILQVLTQIQDSTLSMVPKILAVILMLMGCGGWMLHSMTQFSQHLLLSIPDVIR